MGMRVGERGRDLAGDGERATQVEGAFAANHLAKTRPLDVLHDDEGPSVLRRVEVVHAHRVGVLEAASDDGLVAEAPREVLVVGEPPRDDLDRADLVEGQVPRAIDAGHSARADLVEDLVLAADDHPRLEVGRRAQLGLVLGARPEFVGKDGMASRTVTHALFGTVARARLPSFGGLPYNHRSAAARNRSLIKELTP